MPSESPWGLSSTTYRSSVAKDLPYRQREPTYSTARAVLSSRVALFSCTSARLQMNRLCFGRRHTTWATLR